MQGDVTMTDMLAVVSHLSTKDDSLFKYESSNKFRNSSNSWLCLASLGLFSATFGFLIYKLVYQSRINNGFLTWSEKFITLNELEVNLNDLVVSALKMEGLQSGYFAQDYSKQSLADYQQQLNVSLINYYDCYANTRDFITQGRSLDSLPSLTLYYREQNGIVTQQKENFAIGLKSVYAAGYSLVDILD